MNEEDNFLNEMKKAYDIRDSELESKFKTMLFTYRNALGMLSALNDEFNAITNNLNDLDINILINRYKPVLDKANDLVNKIEDLEDDIKNHSDMKEYLSSIKTHNIDTLVKKFDEVKHKIIKVKEAEERRKQELQRQRDEELKRAVELGNEQKKRNKKIMIFAIPFYVIGGIIGTYIFGVPIGTVIVGMIVGNISIMFINFHMD